jgi:hypothetical protein
MSRSDFDVITGPSMPQRPALEPRRSVRSANDKSQPGAPPQIPAAFDDSERKGAAPTTATGARPVTAE